jgi:membrane-bound serine protease (ClpP class)
MHKFFFFSHSQIRSKSLTGFLFVLLLLLISLIGAPFLFKQASADVNNVSQKSLLRKQVLILQMNMGILPGTVQYLREAIEIASRNNYELIVIKLSTPGGMITATQEMVEDIFKSPVPIVVYVAPTGATATSAGVFLTMAAHVAAMAPGTSIGAAHPVDSNGQTIQGDMRKKVENMAVAMVKSISKQRGRNEQWAEKAVRKSSSLTVDEAIRKAVIDIKGDSISEVLKKIEGREVKTPNSVVLLSGFYDAQLIDFPLSLRLRLLNFLADPTVVTILWLVGTTGLVVELYSPGLILPGVVGAVCLLLALISMHVLPLSAGALSLLVVGALLLIGELFITSGILGFGGVVSLVFGLLYLVDSTKAPDVRTHIEYVLPFLGLVVLGMVGLIVSTVRLGRYKSFTGSTSLIGKQGVVIVAFKEGEGLVLIEGERWRALSDIKLQEGDKVCVESKGEGLTLYVVRS